MSNTIPEMISNQNAHSNGVSFLGTLLARQDALMNLINAANTPEEDRHIADDEDDRIRELVTYEKPQTTDEAIALLNMADFHLDVTKALQDLDLTNQVDWEINQRINHARRVIASIVKFLEHSKAA